MFFSAMHHSEQYVTGASASVNVYFQRLNPRDEESSATPPLQKYEVSSAGVASHKFIVRCFLKTDD